MEYTHYWTVTDKTVELRHDTKTWEYATDFARELMKQYRKWKGEICGIDGYGEPKISGDCIVFNGHAAADEECDPFYIDRTVTDEFVCRTNRKPYDAAVVAMLIELEALGVITSWSSDGESAEMLAGRELRNYTHVALEERREQVDAKPSALKPMELFATYENWDELKAYFHQFREDERRLLIMGAGMAWNLAAHLTNNSGE